MKAATSPRGIPSTVFGIDASRSTAQQRTGTEIYSLQLIRALLRLPVRHPFQSHEFLSLTLANFLRKYLPLLQYQEYYEGPPQTKIPRKLKI